MWRMRLPVSANEAFATAAPVIGTPNSPAPLGGAFDGTISTRKEGDSMRTTLWSLSKVGHRHSAIENRECTLVVREIAPSLDGTS